MTHSASLALLSSHSTKPPSIAASVLAADFAALGNDVIAVQAAGADALHIDIMDGHFVPNLSFGLPIVSAIAPLARIPLDVHLMVSDPMRYVPPLLALQANTITFHIEATLHPVPVLAAIKAGARAGIAINPGTPIQHIAPLLPMLDQICVMTVSPGFGGQAFLPLQMAVLEQAAALCRNAPTPVVLQADGGINANNAATVAAAGANILVAGSAIFTTNNSGVPQTLDAKTTAYKTTLAALRHHSQ